MRNDQELEGYRQRLVDRFGPIPSCGEELIRVVTLRRQGKAHFYWDFDRYYMQHNEAGHFIGQYMEMFPNELDSLDADIYDNFRRPKQMRFVSAVFSIRMKARYAIRYLTISLLLL